jgi:hypothetical protein
MIFGPKKEDVTGHWRKLHNEELCDLYTSQNIVRNQVKEEEIGTACGMYRGQTKCHRILVIRRE